MCTFSLKMLYFSIICTLSIYIVYNTKQINVSTRYYGKEYLENAEGTKWEVKVYKEWSFNSPIMDKPWDDFIGLKLIKGRCVTIGLQFHKPWYWQKQHVMKKHSRTGAFCVFILLKPIVSNTPVCQVLSDIQNFQINKCIEHSPILKSKFYKISQTSHLYCVKFALFRKI